MSAVVPMSGFSVCFDVKQALQQRINTIQYLLDSRQYLLESCCYKRKATWFPFVACFWLLSFFFHRPFLPGPCATVHVFVGNSIYSPHLFNNPMKDSWVSNSKKMWQPNDCNCLLLKPSFWQLAKTSSLGAKVNTEPVIWALFRGQQVVRCFSKVIWEVFIKVMGSGGEEAIHPIILFYFQYPCVLCQCGIIESSVVVSPWSRWPFCKWFGFCRLKFNGAAEAGQINEGICQTSAPICQHCFFDICLRVFVSLFIFLSIGLPMLCLVCLGSFLEGLPSCYLCHHVISVMLKVHCMQ